MKCRMIMSGSEFRLYLKSITLIYFFVLGINMDPRQTSLSVEYTFEVCLCHPSEISQFIFHYPTSV